MFYWLRASHGGVRETLDITGLLILVIPDDIWSSDVGITGYTRGQCAAPDGACCVPFLIPAMCYSDLQYRA